MGMSTVFFDGNCRENGVAVDDLCNGGENDCFEAKEIVRWMCIRGGDSYIMVETQMVPGR